MTTGTTPRSQNCPNFEHNDFEPILEWANAKVWWSNTVHKSDGTAVSNPRYASWGFTWDNGVVGWDALRDNTKKNEVIARRASALFIYLWCKGIRASLADNLAINYARNVCMDTSCDGRIVEDLMADAEETVRELPYCSKEALEEMRACGPHTEKNLIRYWLETGHPDPLEDHFAAGLIEEVKYELECQRLRANTVHLETDQ